MRQLAALLTSATLALGVVIRMAAAPPAPGDHNAHSVYTSLHNGSLSGESHAARDFVLKKDAATFTLTGTLYPVAPVEGRITGAVFLGEGTMTYTPPTAAERAMLRNLTKGEEFHETFQRAVFRFTDDTIASIAASPAGGAKVPPRRPSTR